MRKEPKILRTLYYEIKLLIPRSLQISLRRLIMPRVAKRCRYFWPVNPTAGLPPQGWKGWPHNKKFALVLTHDVDTEVGEDRTLALMALDQNAGFRSAFYFVPGRVRKSATIMPELKKNGFEVGVHGLFHDGKLFKSRAIFRERAAIINRFLSKWQAVGFRAECMHHNLTWIHDLNVLYDASTFDVDPFEPQPDGMTTIFPFSVESPTTGEHYVELPYTLPQDFTLFIILQKKNIDIWKKKLDWVAAQGGMALVITHPDYMNFEDTRLAISEYRPDVYVEFLDYVKHQYDGQFWNALPSEVASHMISSRQASSAHIMDRG